MRALIAVDEGVLEQVLDSVGDASVVRPVSREHLFLVVDHGKPEILIIDEDIGGGRWKVISSIPDAGMKVILLARGVDERLERLAAMAGCYDVIDLTSQTWIEDLEESLRAARARVRFGGPPCRAAETSAVPQEVHHRSVSRPHLM